MEGSVEIDTGVASSNELPESNDSDVVETSTEGQDNSTPEPEAQKEEVKYTEKGTKLDPNPQSAVHQELANERKLRTQYETVLRNPEYLRKYAKEMGLTMAEAKEEIQDKKEELYSADKFQTAEDIARALNEIRSGFTVKTSEYEKKIQGLESEIQGLATVRKFEAVKSTIQSDIVAAREKYPELDPKNASYDPELEKEIGELYHELDFDEATGAYRGSTSIAKLADRIMRAAGRAKKLGSDEAQTVIKERSAGRIVTSGKAVQKESQDSGDPASTIAARINRVMGK